MSDIAAPSIPAGHCPTCTCYRARARRLLWAEVFAYAWAGVLVSGIALALRVW